MPYRIECEGSFRSADATEADIHRAFDDDAARGEFVILHAPDGSYIQAAGEGDGPYALEYRVGGTDAHLCAVAASTKDEVRQAFLAYLRGADSWRTARQWRPLQPAGKGGCLTMLLLAAGTGAGGLAACAAAAARWWSS